MKKRILSAVLAACMVFGSAACLPHNAFTDHASIFASAETVVEGDYTYEIYQDHAVLKKYTGSVINLTLPSTVNGVPVTEIGFQCFYQNTKLISVTVPSSITSIGNAAFSGCTKLKSVAGLNKTKVTYIGLGAFANCEVLDMDYNDFPSTIKTIEGSAFNDCKLLRSIDVSNLSSLGTYAFKNCTSLTALYGFQNCSVKEIPKEAFNNSGLRGNVVMPSVEKVAEKAFYGCTSITNLHLPKVTTLGESCFEECTGLEDITLSEDITELPDFAFYNCKNLYIKGGFSIPAKTEKIGEKCFYGCDNFTYIVVPSKVQSIGSYALGIRKDGKYYQRIVDTIYCYPQSQTVTQKYVDDTGLWQKVEVVTCVHSYNGVTTKKPTCTQKGEMTYTCTKCLLSYKEDIKALNHDFTGVRRKTVTYATPAHDGQYKMYCSKCGGSEEGGIQYGTIYKANERLYGSTRYDTGIAIANQLKVERGGKAFDYFVVCDGRGFADALSASYLATILDAPILLVAPNNETAVINYIKNNGSASSQIMVIGGESAISADIFNKLKAVRSNTTRLAGADRYETSRLVVTAGAMWAQYLKKSLGSSLIIADGNSYADALSSSATGQPIMLVNGKTAKNLTEIEKQLAQAFVDEKLDIVITGGTAAVNNKLEADLAKIGNVTRLAGANRYETSVKVAEHFFKSPSAVTVAYALNFPDGLCGGPLGKATNCPLILTSSGNGAYAKKYAQKSSITTAWILGGTAVVSDAAVKEVLG